MAVFRQHDAQEFLRFLLDGLHEDVNKATPVRFVYKDDDYDRLSDDCKATVSWNRYKRFNDSFIFDVFGGQLESTVTCTACGYRSVTFDAFWDLSVPMRKQGSDATRTGQTQPFTTLTECLDANFDEEILDEPYKCARCKIPQRATKRLRIHRAPHVLTIHLKRFRVSRYTGLPEGKIDSSITFPASGLSLKAYASEVSRLVSAKHESLNQQHYQSPTSIVYDLIAVSHHSGSLGGGHYTATTKNFDDQAWYNKNDSQTSAIKGDLITTSSTAYILLYQAGSKA
eukprot:jgi/Hompol1/443/HPOL_003241-RA